MLTVTDLGYRYPTAPRDALTGVGLTAHRGEILGLLGPNGAGKSTLVALLAGLLTPRDGHIEVDGTPLADVRRENPTRITVAPQEYAFYPMLTVAENLACFAAASRLAGTGAREAIDRAVAATRLDSHAGTRADRLSGGLKRRLNLAIALLPRPELIVLDEPTVGVDPQSRAFLLETVRGLAAAGMAVIYTTHYMEEVEALADRVTIIDHGRVLCQGGLAELLARDPARLDLRLAAPLPAAHHARLGEFGRLQANGDRLSIQLADGLRPAQVLQRLDELGLPATEIRFGRHSLERLFMELTDTRLRDD
ncbi:ABC transporter ATP-binding protein [Zoogloea sp.]|uniref:ABC transporter ATP-binding protein n=1 Tax=Zoogloea sp. TaxID=49181 RepID=UPI0035B07158